MWGNRIISKTTIRGYGDSRNLMAQMCLMVPARSQIHVMCYKWCANCSSIAMSEQVLVRANNTDKEFGPWKVAKVGLKMPKKIQ
jgi:hypothetical protein